MAGKQNPFFYFALLICNLWFYTFSSVCVGSGPAVSDSNALLQQIEQQFPQYFYPGTATKSLAVTDEVAWYRVYPDFNANGLASFQGGLWYALGGNWVRYSALEDGDRVFCNSACFGSTATAEAFHGNIVLGMPASTSIKASVFSPDQQGVVRIAYGTVPGQYSQQTAVAALSGDRPTLLSLTGLMPNTQYYYRLYFHANTAIAASVGDEYRFHTARSVGSRFTFTLQADSHLDENSSVAQYWQTLSNVLADQPDFHIDLGDTFMTEKHHAPLSPTVPMASSEAEVQARYRYERGNFAKITHSVPLFLVNGNHEGEAGWLNAGGAENLANWASLARQQYFLNPTLDDFYSGNPVNDAVVGQRAAWYAWQWGDALFVVLDPYWYTKVKSNKGWDITLGDQQYHWLEQTLASSRARYKLVFLHSLVGGLDGQMRGGIEAAPYFEWGGLNSDGTSGFATQRPNWRLPIHALFVEQGVTAVFHGHDHVYVRQALDGIAYQEVPQPSAVNTASGASLAKAYHYLSGTVVSSAGHLRVSVGPDNMVVEYVRSWLPSNENQRQKNGEIADKWLVLPAKTP